MRKFTLFLSLLFTTVMTTFAQDFTATATSADETMGTAAVEVVDGVATFTATANEGYVFKCWDMDNQGLDLKTNPFVASFDEFLMDLNLVAYFEAAEPAARESFDKAYAAAAEALATAEKIITTTEVALTTEAGQPGYVSTPHDHAVINPNSQWDMGGIAALIDGTKLHFHTAWENVPAGPHYFQVDMGEGESIEAFVFETLNRDDADYDFPSEFTIRGSNDDVDYELISVVDASASAAKSATFESKVIKASKPYRYLRFEVTNCISTGDNNQTGYRTYFHIAEFDLYKVEAEVSEPFADLQRAYDAAANNADADDATLEEYTKALNAGIHFVTAYKWVGEYKVQANVTDLTTDWTTPSPLSFEVATKYQSWKNATDIILKSFADVDLSQASGGGAYPTLKVSEDGKTASLSAGTTVYLGLDMLWDGTIMSKSTILRPADGVWEFTIDENGVVSIPNLEIVLREQYEADYSVKEVATLATLTDVYAGKEGVQLPEPVVPTPAELTVVNVTPNAPVASLETIEIEFSDVTIVKVPNLTAVKDATGADVGWFMNREIDGKVQRLTLMPAITTPGKYTLTIPADVIKNEAGVFYAGGTFEFTVAAAPAVEKFAVSAVLFPAPADPAKVTEIKCIRVQHEMGASIAELPTTWTLTDADNNAVEVNVQWGLADFNDIMIMPKESIKTSGTYTLTIPAGSLKTDDGKEVKAATFSFTVVGEPVAPTGYEYFEGINGHAVRALDSFTIGTLDDEFAFTDNKLAVNDIQASGKGSKIFIDKTDLVFEVKAGDAIGFETFLFHGEWMHAYAYIDYNNDFVFGTEGNPYGETYGELVSYNHLEGVDSYGEQSSPQYANGNKYSDVSAGLPAFFLPAEIAPGEYRMRIKIDYNRADANYGDDWAENNNPKVMGGCQCDFTIKVVGDEPVTPPVDKTYMDIVSVTPTDGSTVEKLHYILLDMGVWCQQNVQGVNVTDADGNKVGYAEFTWKKEDGTQCTDTQLVLKLQEAITAAGTYTIVLPENSIWDYEFGIAVTTLTFTVAPATGTGIDGVDAEVEQVIYDITGRRIEKITSAGVYIVNGVKVLVK